MEKSFVLKGDICHSRNPQSLRTAPDSHAVCEDGVSRGVFKTLPERYASLPLHDHSGKLILPGLCDLHMHAPQYAYRGMGMDLTLLDWLNARIFPEEAKYADAGYAADAYAALVRDLVAGPNTRICLFATVHVDSTLLLMELLERSGLAALVGKVNMDRNCPDCLRETGPADSLAATRDWLERAAGRFANVRPILTPRFIPSCGDELLLGLAELQKEFGLPVQSHLSENPDEVAWVRELLPDSAGYADAYRRFGLFGGDAPTVMAHCVWCDAEETELLSRRGVFVAHCPQSNANLSSGIAPARRYLDAGLRMGLGSDVAGGCHSSIFRAMADAVQMSKLRWRLCGGTERAVTLEEAFWLATAGGGEFFGRVGMFDDGYEFDAVVIDDALLAPPRPVDIPDRLSRVAHLSDDRHVAAKYVGGRRVK